MKKKITSTCKQYHRNPDGSVTYLGEFKYSFIGDVPPPKRTRIRAMTERMLDRYNERQGMVCDDFERLVDAAQEGAD